MKLEELNKAMILAMKNRNKERKDAIASVVGAVKNAAIDKRIKEDIPESLVNEVLLKEVKTIKEMIDTCPIDRVELRTQYESRLAIVEEFAPKLITNEDEIKAIITGFNLEIVNANRGAIMKELKASGVDMAIANKVIAGMLK